MPGRDLGMPIRKPIVVGALWIAGALSGAASAAEPPTAISPAVITIVEGDAVIFRATNKLAAAEGVRVLPDDLIETGAKSLVRIESSEGTRIDLGPSTRIQVNGPARGKELRPALYLMSGWIKFTTPMEAAGAKPPAPSTAVSPAFSSPPVDCTELQGTVVAHIEAGEGDLFLEQGSARLLDRRTRGAIPVRIKSGDFLSWSKDDPLAQAGFPAAGFVKALPRPFENSISGHYARFAAAEVTPRPLGKFTFAEVEPWINAERPIRRQFVRTWRPKVEDPEFRTGLAANMDRHPEWDPILYPEKYLPKPPPVVKSAPPVPDSPALTRAPTPAEKAVENTPGPAAPPAAPPAAN